MNFGCCSVQPDGWVNVDKDDYGQDVIADARCGLPFKDGAFDCIFANHSLQQVNVHDIPAVLAELYRVTAPDGVLRISVPDIVGAFHAYLEGNLDWFPNDEPHLAQRFTNYLTWYGTNTTPFTASALAKYLREAGFEASNGWYGLTKSRWNNTVELLDDREPESIFMEGLK